MQVTSHLQTFKEQNRYTKRHALYERGCLQKKIHSHKTHREDNSKKNTRLMTF